MVSRENEQFRANISRSRDFRVAFLMLFYMYSWSVIFGLYEYRYFTVSVHDVLWHTHPSMCLPMCVSVTCLYVGCIEAFPAAEGLCELSRTVPDPTDQQVEGMEVWAAQGCNWTSLWPKPQPPADMVSCPQPGNWSALIWLVGWLIGQLVDHFRLKWFSN